MKASGASWEDVLKGSIVVSVVVCTYNRADLLINCLESLVRQSANNSDYEVIIVDNNSTDETQQVANTFAARFGNFHALREARQGKSHALNSGISVSKGKYIAFIDDDAKAKSDWLKRIINAFETVRPEPIAVGGEIYPWYEEKPPSWFTDDFEIRTWGHEQGFLQPPRAQFGFSGSNMAIQKKILEQYGGFSVNLGPISNKFSLGEETELFYRVYKEHPRYWYDPEIRVEHFVPVRKMVVKYRLKRAYLGGVSTAYIQSKYSIFSIVKILFSIIIKVVTLPFSVRWLQRNWQKSFLKKAEPIAGSVGLINAFLLYKI